MLSTDKVPSDEKFCTMCMGENQIFDHAQAYLQSHFTFYFKEKHSFCIYMKFLVINTANVVYYNNK